MYKSCTNRRTLSHETGRRSHTMRNAGKVTTGFSMSLGGFVAVTEFENRYDHLDVLINNAAVFTRQRTITADGYETMFATNHLGPFLLTNLLLECLKAATSARILPVTAPSTTKITLEDLQAEHKFSAMRVFGATKACNLLFTYDLAHRLAGTTVTDNAFYPGIVKSPRMRDAPAPLRCLNPVFGQSPEPVAQSVLYYASSPEVQGMTGLLFNKSRQSINSSPYTKDRAVQQRLWEASLALAPLEEVTPSERIYGGNKKDELSTKGEFYEERTVSRWYNYFIRS